jgi:hypothetical protein
MKTIPNSKVLSDRPPGTGLLRNIWNAIVAFDDGLNFDPVDDLRRRVRNLEGQLRDVTERK